MIGLCYKEISEDTVASNQMRSILPEEGPVSRSPGEGGGGGARPGGERALCQCAHPLSYPLHVNT